MKRSMRAPVYIDGLYVLVEGVIIICVCHIICLRFNLNYFKQMFISITPENVRKTLVSRFFQGL